MATSASRRVTLHEMKSGDAVTVSLNHDMSEVRIEREGGLCSIVLSPFDMFDFILACMQVDEYWRQEVQDEVA